MLIIVDFAVRFTPPYTNSEKEVLCETEQEAFHLCTWLRSTGATANAIRFGERKATQIAPFE